MVVDMEWVGEMKVSVDMEIAFCVVQGGAVRMRRARQGGGRANLSY